MGLVLEILQTIHGCAPLMQALRSSSELRISEYLPQLPVSGLRRRGSDREELKFVR